MLDKSKACCNGYSISLLSDFFRSFGYRAPSLAVICGPNHNKPPHLVPVDVVAHAVLQAQPEVVVEVQDVQAVVGGQLRRIEVGLDDVEAQRRAQVLHLEQENAQRGVREAAGAEIHLEKGMLGKE